MFIVMNRFQVNSDREGEFQESWRQRESHLQSFEGFRGFSLLRNDHAGEGTREYISHTVWRSRADFEAWRTSDEFNRAHAQGSVAGILAGPPQASMYEAVLEESSASAGSTA